MKKIFLIFVLISLIFYGCNSTNTQSNSVKNEQVKSPVIQEELPSEKLVQEKTEQEILTNVIKITSTGFSPTELKIKHLETVKFVNMDNNKHWPASNVHPTHSEYPDFGGCIGSKFDSCKGLEKGEEFSFTFTEKGSWNYHDHLRPSFSGIIIVE